MARPGMSLGGLWSVEFDAPRANYCTGIITRDAFDIVSASESAVLRFE